MMYEEVIKDFAERTKQNLDTIEKLQKDGSEVFETTQLINSCLGLLIFPREEYLQKIPRMPLEKLEHEGWPIPRVTEGFKQVSDLRELISFLRHSIAHFNIEFIGDGHNVIRTLKVWNFRNSRKVWEAELSVDDLRKIAEKFTDQLIHYQ